MAGDRLDRHPLARPGIGHEDRPGRGIGNAVAAMPEARNGELFGHLAAPSRNSVLPSPPAIGEGIMPSTRQPSEATKAEMSSQTAACTAGSRTMPFLAWARPASNCGLISAMSCAGGFAKASERKSTRLNSSHLGISYAVFCL